MSKNNPNQASSTNSNQKQDKSFSIWNLFNSKTKNCETKNCDDENCEFRLTSTNGQLISSNHQLNCCQSTNETIKMSSSQLIENLSETNSISKRINFIREFNEIIDKHHIDKHHICNSNFRLIIYKTLDVFGLKCSNEHLIDITIDERKQTISFDDQHQLRLNILRMYTKLIEQQYQSNQLDQIDDELRKLLFDILIKSIRFDESINLTIRNELNDYGLDLLNALTANGKKICCFRFEIDNLMLNWFDHLDNSRQDLICKYLNLLITLIRYHASAFMNLNSKFIEKINRFFMDNYENRHSNNETLLCLEFFDIIFRYSWLPPEVLKPFLITLCIAINYDNLRELAWKILRNLMNKDLAYIVINNLIEFLNENQLNDDQILIVCGSIHFLSNLLWNEETKFDQIKHQPSSLLPTLSRLLSKENLVISTQIAISIKQLLETQLNKLEINLNGLTSSSIDFTNSVTSNSNTIMNSNLINKRKEIIVNLNDDNDSLLFVYWDHVWSILQQLTDYCSKCICSRDANQRSNLNGIKSDFNRLIDELDIIVMIIEKLFLNSKQFNCDEKTFNFICVYTGLQMRTLGFENEYPLFLIKRINILIENYEQIINSNYENWLQSLNRMMDQFFKNNLDTNLRIKTIKCLKNRLKMNTEKDEELIIDKIVLAYFKDVDQEIDFKVRDQILRFLISFLKESSNDLLFYKVLEIISRVLKKTLNRSRNNSDTSNDANCLEEDPNVLIVRGLIEIFEERIYAKNFQPSLEIFKLLSIYVCSHHCEGGNNFEKISINMRLRILFFMFKIKPNFEGYIGLQKDDKKPIKFSRYLKCRKANQMPKSPSINSTNNQMLSSFSLSNNPSSTTNQFSYDDMFIYVNLCLSKERDWNILSIVLENLPAILSNPHIIYSTNYEQIIRIICENCLTLVKEFPNLNQTNNYINMPKNAKSAELQIYVFSVLTALIPYRDLIKPEIQTSIVSEIRKGLCSKESMQQCIMFLTIFTIEFQDAISKELTIILTTLSKTTASSQLAIPKLEFLSTLNLWPDLYSSFTNTEFLSIFAIILPYTNPMKFDDYIVAFAYRVSTMWYLSSRYQFRKTITDYIIKQLPENIKYGNKQSKDAAFTDEYRKRSSSLTTENDIKQKPSTVVDSSINNNGGRLSSFTNNTLVNTIINSSNGNLHNSPAIQSPGLGNQNSSIFNFNLDKANSSAVPNSPNPKQFANTTSVVLQQQLNNPIHHSTVQQQQSQELLHTEYVESFVDLMSRNVVCSCSTLPNQDPISKFLLENGFSETWIFGNKLITITTSSCNSKAVKGGDLCENCFNKLNAFEGKTSTNMNIGITTTNTNNNSVNTFTNKNLNNDDDVFNEPTIQQSNKNTKLQSVIDHHSKFNLSDKDFLSSRRRHQSAFVQTASNSVNRKLTSRDDLHIENNTHMYNSCRSWASGWAEVLIRTPTGNTSWIVKLQNSLFSNFQSNEINDLLLNHLITVSDHKSQTNDQSNAMCSSTNNQSSVSLNQQLSQISEQPYLTASTTNLSHQSALRGRSNTISTSSEMSLKRNELRLTNSLLRTNDNDLKFKNKMQPSFVFLQFFYQGTFGNPSSSKELPILLPKVSPFENTLRIFDLITPSETYKVGIIYVDKNQNKDRQEILGNEYGSERYMNFIKRVGSLVRLDEIDSQKVFIGGLSQDGTDGDFACIHHENLTQVVFHVATFMPKKENDPKSNDKMRHIGNNHVCIVYNDSQEEFDFSVIKGQWLKVCIIVTPFTHEQNFIHVQAIPELENLIMYKRQYPVIISDSNMPHFVRQLSISTSLMSLVYQCKGQTSSNPPFLSNWVNRIRKIKDIKAKVKRYSDMTDSIKHKPITSTSTNFCNNSNEDVCSAISDLDSIMNNFTNYI